jgi:argininosuccinate synthase
MLKEALHKTLSKLITGEVVLKINKNNRCTCLDTFSRTATYDSTKLSMENTKTMFTPKDRIGQLNILNPKLLCQRETLLNFKEMKSLTLKPSGIPKIE